MNTDFQYTTKFVPAKRTSASYPFISVDSNHIKEAIDFLKSENVDTICISKFQGYMADNIDFILDIDNLRGIRICDVDPDINLSAIEKCSNLQRIFISEYVKKTINLSHFPFLELLILSWMPNYELPSAETSKHLKHIHLWQYREKTLKTIPHYQNLEELCLFNGSVVSLEGLERFQNLQLYEHHYGKNLRDISALTQLPNLNELVLDHCKKIEVKDIFEQCKKLTVLKYLACPDLPSLSFLEKMKYIEWMVFFDMNVLDGDVAPLLKLKKFAFRPNKKHYSHTCEELKKIHECPCLTN